MGQIHQLKTLAQYYDQVACGAKTFEVRRDDRGYQKGDLLILYRVTSHEDKRWALNAHVKRRISYVLCGGQFGIELGYVVLGLQEEEPLTIPVQGDEDA